MSNFASKGLRQTVLLKNKETKKRKNSIEKINLLDFKNFKSSL
jgi:hypothetical protein